MLQNKHEIKWLCLKKNPMLLDGFFEANFFTQKIEPQNIKLWRSCRYHSKFVNQGFWEFCHLLVDIPGVDRVVMLVHILISFKINRLRSLEWNFRLMSRNSNFLLIVLHCLAPTIIHTLKSISSISSPTTNHKPKCTNHQSTSSITNHLENHQSSMINHYHHFETAELSASSASFAATLAFPISSSFSSSDSTEFFLRL